MAGESMMSDKKTGAVDYGKKHNSCTDAMEWRKSLGPTATQADAYLACDRGDWLIWQLNRLTPEQYLAVKPALDRAIGKIVARSIRRGVRSLRGIREAWATGYRRWARRWFSGEDRTWEAAREAWVAAEAAAGAAAWAAGAAAWEAGAAEAAELKLQARDIRKEIPAWTGRV